MDANHRRRAISTVLAMVLALESVAAVAAVGSVLGVGPLTAPQATVAPAGEVLAEVGTADRASDADLATVRALSDGAALPAPDELPAPAAASAPDVRDYASPKRVAPTVSVPAATKPATKAKASASATAAPATKAKATTKATTTYKGRNHMWIPSLGINRAVVLFPCDRQRPPDNFMYRWGCAGTNNVYLMAHASTVFKPLHDAYVKHTLKVGMQVIYADGKGVVHTYAVTYWRLVLPTTAASWAWAAQSAPTMTLQTCMGVNSKYRLIVRLAQVS